MRTAKADARLFAKTGNTGTVQSAKYKQDDVEQHLIVPEGITVLPTPVFRDAKKTLRTEIALMVKCVPEAFVKIPAMF